MKALLLLCLFFYSSIVSRAQTDAEFRDIQNIIQNIPLSETYSSASIAKYIQSNFKTAAEKIRAAYYWVTHNISYSTDSMYVINYGKDPNLRITEALRRRKGVCENFAAIFNDVVVKCGIRSFEVTGYTKQYGSIDKAAHTWCVVYLQNEWLCCDPTWDIGFTNQARYFLISPAQFIESHMPFDPLWQLLGHTVSHTAFDNGNTYAKKGTTVINFLDSINAYMQLSELQQLEAAISRIQRSGIANELVRVRLSYLQMEASIFYQDRDMYLYNAAVSDLNQANTIFNEFIRYRNNRFIPQKPDEEIRSMILPVDGFLEAAYKKLDELDASPVNFQYNSGSLRDRLAALMTRLKEQKHFLDRYFATDTSKRERLFYD